MPNLLNVESIEARRAYSEANDTRFDRERFPEAPAFTPEPSLANEEMYTHSPHLEVAVSAEHASELARPAGDMFAIPQTPEQEAKNQHAYVEALTAEQTNLVSLETRRYHDTSAMINEALNAGESVVMCRQDAA